MTVLLILYGVVCLVAGALGGFFLSEQWRKEDDE
jgi:uncharacterized protein YneF (UPF0154 family)